MGCLQRSSGDGHMITGPQPYPAMKPSGVEWLGDVPDHWDLVPNRALVRQRKVLVGERHGDYTLLSLTKRGVIVRDVDNGGGKFSADMGTSQEVRAGDLVFCLFDVPETPRTVGLSHHDGMITGAYTVFEYRGLALASYFDLFYRAMDDRKLLSPLYSGLRNTIPLTRFLGAKSPVPPLDEQAAIVRYLDHVDRRTNRYIRAKQRLIELLEEEKQAIIHRAVTRGLDPDVPLKPSGVEWLGDVPEHWECHRLKAILQPVDRRSVTGSETLLSLRRDHGVVMYAEHFTRPPQSASLAGFKLVEAGQLVVNRLQANNGLIFRSTIDGLVSPDYSVFQEKFPVQMHFISDVCRTSYYRAHFRQEATGLGTGTAGFLRLYDDKFLDTHVYLPRLPEQVAILGYLDETTAVTDAGIEGAHRQIDLLREYRTRIIADVVTGKLDVREAAADLPEVYPADLKDIIEIDDVEADDLDAELEEVAT